MNFSFDWLDLTIFLLTLGITMLIGFLASKQETNSNDFFLGGKTIRWWGVAGSIFGTNISATHIVGMLGVGYSVGFAQSHYEFGAIPALLLLAYIFLPVYHKLGVTTLSEYLEKRFDERARLLYSIILILLILLQMVAAFYIGSRSMVLLFRGTGFEVSYITGIIILAFVSTAYTIYGGLKAVVWTDVLQSIIVLIGSIVICYLTFATPEVGGWSGLLEKESLSGESSKMRLFLPSDHPDLPFTGAFTGLIILHFFYWGTNQYLVQRALGAISEQEARTGIIFASFLKLLVPFLSIATGVASFHYFKKSFPSLEIAPDSALPILLGSIVPKGFGLSGIIASAILGAILSSIDSMMNSASTLFTLDIYKKYINKEASDEKLIKISQIGILVVVILSMVGAMIFFSPDYKGSFVIKISALSSYLTPGIVVAFLAGILSRRVSPSAAFFAILFAPIFSLVLEYGYDNYLNQFLILKNIFGVKLNFLHRVAITIGGSYLILIIISRFSKRYPDRELLNWMEISGASKTEISILVIKIIVFLIFQIIFVILALRNLEQKHWISLVGFVFTMSLFLWNIIRKSGGFKKLTLFSLFRDDRFYAGILASVTASIFLYFI
ncbi:MAG: sodium/solute symporter [Leptospiraceae bacterium]|nr:sodium/solute symporter [Leptospiraceae bacterium]